MIDLKVLVKGAGEMATGVAHRLYMANIRRVVMTEKPEPLAVRRTVAFSEAVWEGRAEVEGVTAELARTIDDVYEAWKRNHIGIIVDPGCSIMGPLKPDVVVDATMVKRNAGTGKGEAPLVIGIGPGFTAPENVDVVVESNRGHNLGRVIFSGSAEPFTGVPGLVMVPGTSVGYTKERVLRSPHGGLVRHVKQIGDMVQKGDIVLHIGDTAVPAPISGMLRGLIREIAVSTDEKIGDIDPRGKREYCFTITEKARGIGGGVLEAIMHVMNK
jgi:xanthine dehydrogenase accessory factor